MSSDFTAMGRFAEPALLILTSLAGGERHGYAIMDDVRTMTGITLGAGTLYAALSRLGRAGLIESGPLEERRRPYRLTPAGITTLRTQVNELQRLTATASDRLALL